MKFNVHHWDGKTWNYLATVRAKNEMEACQIASFRFALTNSKLQAYPHMDNFAEVK